MHNKVSRNGFTLIEVLVVILIIAILAAILFPIFARVKERARQVSCLNNLSQLGKAIRMYADDNGGRMPKARPANELNTIQYQNWCGNQQTLGPTVPGRGQIYSYVTNDKLFLCPSDANKRASANTGLTPIQQARYPLSYSMNLLLSWRNFTTMRRPPITLSAPNLNTSGTGQNKRRERILLLIHEKRSTINDGDFNWLADKNVFPVTLRRDLPTDVHWKGTTVLYCDLHAKWVSAKDLVAAQDSDVWDPDKYLP